MKNKKEIERKWKPESQLENLESYYSKELLAGYYQDKNGDVRIRKEGDSIILTYKL